MKKKRIIGDLVEEPIDHFLSDEIEKRVQLNLARIERRNHKPFLKTAAIKTLPSKKIE